MKKLVFLVLKKQKRVENSFHWRIGNRLLNVLASFGRTVWTFPEFRCNALQRRKATVLRMMNCHSTSQLLPINWRSTLTEKISSSLSKFYALVWFSIKSTHLEFRHASEKIQGIQFLISVFRLPIHVFEKATPFHSCGWILTRLSFFGQFIISSIRPSLSLSNKLGPLEMRRSDKSGQPSVLWQLHCRHLYPVAEIAQMIN